MAKKTIKEASEDLNPNSFQPVTFQAIFSKASTLVDGGWRVSFDLNSNEGPAILALKSLEGQILGVAAAPSNLE